MSRKLSIAFCFLMLVWLLAGCSGDDNPAETPGETLVQLTCVECHTNQEQLVALAQEDPELSGEAGEG